MAGLSILGRDSFIEGRYRFPYLPIGRERSAQAADVPSVMQSVNQRIKMIKAEEVFDELREG